MPQQMGRGLGALLEAKRGAEVISPFEPGQLAYVESRLRAGAPMTGRWSVDVWQVTMFGVVYSPARPGLKMPLRPELWTFWMAGLRRYRPYVPGAKPVARITP